MSRNEIVVGVDENESGRAALVWALEEAALRGATVLAVNAWNHEPLSDFAFTSAEAVREGSRTLLAEAVAAAREQVPAAVAVETRSVSGSPSVRLLEAAEDAALLVVGSHRGGLLREVMLGSCAAACVRHATVPVVVIPPPNRVARKHVEVERPIAPTC
ncbi:universal stress protein [Allokutzneria albata]|uniref:Nucleotide-binding universal stress protein, UspA family n=1 Tax=Allokutzneria albata TaxID=211114 RepID=A0A1G9SJZ1_ALLAB|nr:universal stress protein [Allokutzneria albata]SDM35798.1 Nucleotide-binding universal stress protein, UspA family [Allokutzneria albata]